MPKKPMKWDINVWYLTDSVSKYVWSFDVYFRVNKRISSIKASKRGETMQGAKVVFGLLEGLEH